MLWHILVLYNFGRLLKDCVHPPFKVCSSQQQNGTNGTLNAQMAKAPPPHEDDVADEDADMEDMQEYDDGVAGDCMGDDDEDEEV